MISNELKYKTIENWTCLYSKSTSEHIQGNIKEHFPKKILKLNKNERSPRVLLPILPVKYYCSTLASSGNIKTNKLYFFGSLENADQDFILQKF